MQIIRKISTITLLFFLSLFLKKNEVIAQIGMDMERFSMEIQTDTIAISSGQFVFNSITIKNTSSQNIRLGLRFNLPSGWNFVTPMAPSIEINSNNFQTLPFRIIPSRMALGDVKYPITVFVKNPISGVEYSKSFFVKIKQNTNWNANLIQSNLMISEDDSLMKFQLRIKNNGNKRELFEISTKSDLRLSMPSMGTQVLLRPGQDSTLIIYVASKFNTSLSKPVTFTVKSKNETIMLSGTVFFTTETFQGNKSRYGTIPISFELFNINTFAGDLGYTFLDINGAYEFSKNRSINFRMRSNTYTKDFAYKNHFYTFDYNSRKFGLNIGNQNLFFNYQISGMGSKLIFRTNTNNTYDIYALKSQRSDAYIAGFNHENKKVANRNISTKSLFIKDNDLDQLIFFAIHNFEKRYSKTKMFSLSGGYGSEKHDSIKVFKLGYMYGYRFETNFRIGQLASSIQHYDDNYPGVMKGVKFGSHMIKIGDNKKSVIAFSESNTRQQYFEEESLLELQQSFSNQEHGLRLAFQKKRLNSQISYSYFEQYQKLLGFGVMNGFKTTLNLSQSKKEFSQSLMLNYVKSRIKEVNSNNYNNAYNIFYQIKYKDFGIYANYTNGPFMYFDYLSLFNDNKRPQTHNVSIDYVFKNKAKTFYNRINLSNNKNSIITKPVMVFRNELFFEMPKYQSSISIFGNVNVFDVALAPSLNISLKKTIDVPLIVKRKYYSASVFLFKDKNNNDMFDNGEEAVSDVYLNINGNALKTNKKGMVFLKNVEKDYYIVDYRKIENLKGWVPKEKSLDTLYLDRDVSIGVPFKQSRMVEGIVKFEDENSIKTINDNHSGILIMAINMKGEIFRSTTNSKGEFFLNLKEDIYNIQIPTNIFGDDKHVERTIITVDLLKKDSASIEFKVVQKKRRINIKKD